MPRKASVAFPEEVTLICPATSQTYTRDPNSNDPGVVKITDYLQKLNGLYEVTVTRSEIAFSFDNSTISNYCAQAQLEALVAALQNWGSLPEENPAYGYRYQIED